MSLRLHEISETHHRILNPFTEEKLMLLGQICRLREGQQQLDLCSGKGEMLCRWAEAHGIEGVGVDISHVFLAAANARAAELKVADKVRFEYGDASAYPAEKGGFDIVSCIGATWIGKGLVGTIDLMRPALRPDGLMLIGEPYWTEEPPEGARQAHGDEWVPLDGVLDRVEGAGMELVEMVLADGDSWDRYAASQWWSGSEWLRANPEAPEAATLAEFIAKSRRDYLAFGRRYLGWGVFVMRARRD